MIARRRAHAEQLRPLARRAWLARTQAQSAGAVSLSEPETVGSIPTSPGGALPVLRRLV
jgi:hypothetical protein